MKISLKASGIPSGRGKTQFGRASRRRKRVSAKKWVI